MIYDIRDTVGSVGIIPRRLPFTSSNSHIRHFRHAVSLDERRARFKPNLWNHSTAEEEAMGVKKGEMPRGGHDIPADDEGEENFEEHAEAEQGEKKQKMEKQDDESMSAFERRFEEEERRERDANEPTDILEVWFGGAHTGEGLCSIYYHIFTYRSSFANRRWRWLSEKRHASQPRTYPSPLDDPTMFHPQTRHHVPRQCFRTHRHGP